MYLLLEQLFQETSGTDINSKKYIVYNLEIHTWYKHIINSIIKKYVRLFFLEITNNFF